MFISLSLVAGLDADVKIIANPTAVENFGSVTISWDGDYIPAVGDYISYSCGPTNTITDDIGRCPVLPSPSLKTSNEDVKLKVKQKRGGVGEFAPHSGAQKKCAHAGAGKNIAGHRQRQ